MTLPDRLRKEAVLRVGAVSAVTGRKVFVSVDTDKNLSELFYDGDVLRNIAVGSYVDIRKGFLSLIGRVEGENARIEGEDSEDWAPQPGRRTLAISLVGFLDREGQFFGGTKELPLVGNEAFLLYVRLALLILAEPSDPAEETRSPLGPSWLLSRYRHSKIADWQSVFAHAIRDPLFLLTTELPRTMVLELGERSRAWPADLRRRWTYAAAVGALGGFVY